MTEAKHKGAVVIGASVANPRALLGIEVEATRVVLAEYSLDPTGELQRDVTRTIALSHDQLHHAAAIAASRFRRFERELAAKVDRLKARAAAIGAELVFEQGGGADDIIGIKIRMPREDEDRWISVCVMADEDAGFKIGEMLRDLELELKQGA